MTNEEARFILSAYRPNGHDAADPAFAAALEQAKTDPALGQWFAREQAHAAAMAAKLRELAPPADLRGAILAGAAADRRGGGTATRRLQAWWFALAAALAILGVAALGLRVGPPAGEARLVEAAMVHARRGEHGGHGEEVAALQARLGNPAVRLGVGMPIDFSALKATGCRTLRVAGREVLEICFLRDGAEYHLYVARRGDFGPVQADEFQFVEQARVAAATWADERHRFVLVSGAGLDAVRRLL